MKKRVYTNETKMLLTLEYPQKSGIDLSEHHQENKSLQWTDVFK